MKATDGTSPNSLSPRPDNTHPARTTATNQPRPKSKTRSRETRQPPRLTRQLTYKQRIFISHYLGEANGNAVAAARAAGYRWPEKVAHRLVGKSGIRAAIEAKLDTAAMHATEILARLSAIAAASPLDFVDTTGRRTRLKQPQPNQEHLIKKIRQTRYGIEITLYDATKALELLGQFHGIWRQQPENATAYIDRALDEVEAALAQDAITEQTRLENKGNNT